MNYNALYNCLTDIFVLLCSQHGECLKMAMPNANKHENMSLDHTTTSIHDQTWTLTKMFHCVRWCSTSVDSFPKRGLLIQIRSRYTGKLPTHFCCCRFCSFCSLSFVRVTTVHWYIYSVCIVYVFTYVFAHVRSLVLIRCGCIKENNCKWHLSLTN